ncbi:MAG: hypothetical protein V3R66_08340 [Rhodospirillales bacterium]
MKAETLVNLVARGGIVLYLGSTIKWLFDQRTREINPMRIYSSSEAARFLGVDRRSVVLLIKNNKMQGKLVRGNFRIMGQSILEYLSQ